MSSFTFNGISSTLAAHKITSVLRVDRPLSPGQEANLVRIIGRDGAYFLSKDRRIKTIPVLLAVNAETIQARQAAIRAIANWVETENEAALIFNDEPTIRDMCHGAVDAVIPDYKSPTAAYVLVNFVNYYGYSEKTATSDGTTNNGTLKTPVRLTATIKTDPASSYKITLAQTGEFVLLTHALAIDDVIVIDTNKRTVTVNGADARAGVSFDSDFFFLVVGLNTLQQVPSSGWLSLLYRERYK